MSSLILLFAGLFFVEETDYLEDLLEEGEFQGFWRTGCAVAVAVIAPVPVVVIVIVVTTRAAVATSTVVISLLCI